MESTQEQKIELAYTLFCDDVRLEVGNKLSYMGIFQNIIVPQVPVWLPKLAVVNHWRGAGGHFFEVRILMPDRQQAFVVSHAARFEISQRSAVNISVFVDMKVAGAVEVIVADVVE